MKTRSVVLRTSRHSVLVRLGSELLPVIMVSVLLMAARSSLADHYVIPSGSMEYTLIPGDHVLVDKLSYGLRVPFTRIELASGKAPKRGEVIIFDSPKNGRRLIKRIVAQAGDRVSLIDGELRIDGRSLRDPAVSDLERFGEHLAHLNLSRGGGPNVGAMVVPAGQLLVMGDARGNSEDGRYFGLISEDLPYGLAKRVIYRSGEGLVWKPL
jgi:signal peptidase I